MRWRGSCNLANISRMQIKVDLQYCIILHWIILFNTQHSMKFSVPYLMTMTSPVPYLLMYLWPTCWWDHYLCLTYWWEHHLCFTCWWEHHLCLTCWWEHPWGTCVHSVWPHLVRPLSFPWPAPTPCPGGRHCDWACPCGHRACCRGARGTSVAWISLSDGDPWIYHDLLRKIKANSKYFTNIYS